MTNFFSDSYFEFCQNRKLENKYRELIINKTNDLIDFSSNDYLLLGSSKNKDAIKFASKISSKYGVGSTGSRLLSGNNQFIMDFEKQIARDKNTAKALIFSSGYQANFSVLSSLADSKVLGQRCEMFFAKANHSSLYQAAFLSKAELIRYDHHDVPEFEKLLELKRNTNKPKFIVSETVFGMDGDIVDIKTLVELAKKYNSLLYLDEAHATGLYGESGYGLSSEYTDSYENIIIMGTFSKALGSSGAYIASTNIIIDYLTNNCSGFIYSTAPSPMNIAVAKFNWDKISTPEMNLARIELQNKSKYLIKKLHSKSISVLNPSDQTNIILIECKTSEESLRIKNHLLSKNILVSAIRPPTTPSPRIRIALNVGHSYEEIDELIKVF